MIKLSKRLEKIAELVEKDDTVLDIGCDHALLDIYLSNKYSKVYVIFILFISALVFWPIVIYALFIQSMAFIGKQII